MPMQGKVPLKENLNHPGPSADQATKRIQGPVFNARAGNPTKSGGINRPAAGKP